MEDEREIIEMSWLEIRKIVNLIGINQSIPLPLHLLEQISAYIYKGAHRLRMNTVFEEMLIEWLIGDIYDGLSGMGYNSLKFGLGLDLNKVTPQMFRDYVGEEGYKYANLIKILADGVEWDIHLHPGLDYWIDNHSNTSEEFFRLHDDIMITIFMHLYIHRSQHIIYHLHKPIPSLKKIHKSHCSCNLFYKN